jgi:hypothetical protein
MRYAKVVKGTVVNVVKADDALARKQGLIAAPDDIGVGDTYDATTKNFAKTPEPAPTVQIELTKGQITARILMIEREIAALKNMVGAL